MVSLDLGRRSFSRASPTLASLRKWEEGIRLDLDPYTITPSQLVDGCDVEISGGGSVCTRRPIEPFTTTELPARTCGMWQYQSKDGDDYLMVALEDGSIMQVTNGPAPVVKSVFPASTDGKCCWHSWQANGLLYVSNGTKVFEWNGTDQPKDVTSVEIHDNEDTENETDYKMTNKGVPPSCVATNWGEAVWLAQPTTDYGEDEDAVWFSGQLGKYDELDGDFGGQRDFFSKQRLVAQTDMNADDIVSLVPCGDKLMIFKHGSTHEVTATGDDLSTFAIKEVSRDFGASGPKAAGCSLGLTWLYDARQGPIAITAEGAQSIGIPLGNVAKRNKAPELAAVGFCQEKVFFSVAEHGKECNDTTYVFNQNTKSWSRMCVGFDCFYSYCPDEGRSYCVAATTSPCKSLVWLDGDEDNDTLVDDFGCYKKEYHPWVQTAWIDASAPNVAKRWTGYNAQIEIGTEPVCLITSTPTDWQNNASNYKMERLVPDDGGCYITDDDGCVQFDKKCYEITSVGGTKKLTKTIAQTDRSPAETTVHDISVLPCVSRSAGLVVRSESGGRWCLRQIFTYHYSKRIRA